MKVITVRPPETVLIKDPLDDGFKEYKGIFNTKTVLLFQDAMHKAGIVTLDENFTLNLLPYVLYACINADGSEAVSIEDAEAMADRMGGGSGMMIINMFLESLEESMTETQKKTALEAAKYLLSRQS